MLLMFEAGIRGGITQAVHRYASANNRYIDNYNPNAPSYIQYLDANNLYGWAMSQPLPTGGFKWVDLNPNDINELATKKDKGYLLKVDVRYPTEIHESHDELLFLSKGMDINGVAKLVRILEINPNMWYTKEH